MSCAPNIISRLTIKRTGRNRTKPVPAATDASPASSRSSRPAGRLVKGMAAMTQTPREFNPNEPAPANGAETVPPVASGTVGTDPDLAPPAVGTPYTDSAATTDSAHRTEPAGSAGGKEPSHVTRAGMVWAAVASALVVLILLIVFILQNQDYVQVKYFGMQGDVALGIALFIAAVGGGVLVAIAGAARIIQLRRAAHRQRLSAGARR